MITSHLINYTDANNILYPFQHDFKVGLASETQFLEFIDYITKYIDEGNQTYCLIIDFSKAFHKVSQSLLVHNLHQYNIREILQMN